ncbi:MAG: thioredoxin family protein, partial [Opitutales bacterium]
AECGMGSPGGHRPPLHETAHPFSLSPSRACLFIAFLPYRWSGHRRSFPPLPAMKSILLARLIAVLFLCFALTAMRAEEKPSPAFAALTFEAAGQQAAAEHKIVFVDFYTTWCGPCKMLDQTTWQDPAVIALLSEKAIALRLDAEKEKELARRYKVAAYPTLLLLKPDGTEIDRIIGYREPAKFIEEFKAGLAGKTALQRARDAVATASNDDGRVMARTRLGFELAQAGQSEAALAEYLWCYDENLAKATQSYSGFLLRNIAVLGEQYPPARDALIKRRDKAKAAFLSGNADPATIRELSYLNISLQAEAETLALYDQLKRDDARRPLLGSSLSKPLLAAKRYQDLLDATPYVTLKEKWNNFQATGVEMVARKEPTGMLMMQRKFCVDWLGETLEVLAGAGDLAHARELIASALAFDATDEARASYREHLTRAGHAEMLVDTVPAG